MSWAQRLKRVFSIDMETCPACGGAMRIIACIEDPVVIEKILAHLDAKAAAAQAAIRQKFEGKVAQGNMEAAREAYEVVMEQEKKAETQHA